MRGVPSQKWATSGYHYHPSQPAASKGWHATHFVLHVRETRRKVDGKHDEYNVRFWIAQRAEPIVLFLASGVPQRELDMLALKEDHGHIVLEDGGYVRLRASNGGER